MSETNIKKLSKKSSVLVSTSSPKHTSSDETSRATLIKATCAEKSEFMVLYLTKLNNI